MNRKKQTAPERKGPGRTADVSAETREGLNSGVRESATLAEALAVDFAALMEHVLPEAAEDAASRMGPSTGITKRMAEAGKILLERLGPGGFDHLSSHPSDTVRGWAAYLLAATPDLTLEERLSGIRPLADDHHFGVREWAWLALRPHIASDIRLSVEALVGWVTEASPNLRRFAAEGTRPRGVWSPHIKELKANPGIGLPLLDPLKADPSPYVQDSVANWLNDAAKSQPEWARATCRRWMSQSEAPQTARICRRALRSLRE